MYDNQVVKALLWCDSCNVDRTWQDFSKHYTELPLPKTEITCRECGELLRIKRVIEDEATF